MHVKGLYVLALTMLFSANALCSTDIVQRVEATSEGIIASQGDLSSKYVDSESVTDSLYQVFRPRVEITRQGLSEKEIDVKTRSYVREKYVPALLKNYVQIYSALKASGNPLVACDKKTFYPARQGSNLSISLCIKEVGAREVHVAYFARYGSHEPRETTGFVFSNEPQPILVGIKLTTSPNKVSVEGV